jgi:formate dehydrogenase assembly factor FdhD
MPARTARRRVLRITVGAGAAHRADLLAAEEPLGIRIGGQAVTLTMRTPGDDLDLVAGFLVSEGIVRRAADIAEMMICSGERCGRDHGPRRAAPELPHLERLRRLREDEYRGALRFAGL